MTWQSRCIFVCWLKKTYKNKKKFNKIHILHKRAFLKSLTASNFCYDFKRIFNFHKNYNNKTNETYLTISESIWFYIVKPPLKLYYALLEKVALIKYTSLFRLINTNFSFKMQWRSCYGCFNSLLDNKEVHVTTERQFERWSDAQNTVLVYHKMSM